MSDQLKGPITEARVIFWAGRDPDTLIRCTLDFSRSYWMKIQQSAFTAIYAKTSRNIAGSLQNNDSELNVGTLDNEFATIKTSRFHIIVPKAIETIMENFRVIARKDVYGGMREDAKKAQLESNNEAAREYYEARRDTLLNLYTFARISDLSISDTHHWDYFSNLNHGNLIVHAPYEEFIGACEKAIRSNATVDMTPQPVSGIEIRPRAAAGDQRGAELLQLLVESPNFPKVIKELRSLPGGEQAIRKAAKAFRPR